jgi:hypothetical protein
LFVVRILFIALTFFAFSGRAVTSGDWIYNIIADSDPSVPRVAQITGYNGPDGDVSIPSSIDGIPITIIGIGQMSQPVFNSTSVVTNIAISSGIKVIENWAFYGYTNLKRITFPDTITNIGHAAFDGCSGLEEITIPASLTGISYFAFNNCSNLRDFFVSPLNPYYSSSNGVLFSKDGSNLIIFPAGKSGAFEIPAHVNTISYAAFATASKLTTVFIPSSVTNIDGWPFAACFDLTNISVSVDNMTYESSEGVLYTKGLSSLVTFPAGKVGTFTVPASVSSIADVAFKKCIGLTYVNIPNTVTNLGSGIFVDCTALVGVSLPSNLTDIPSDTFANCPSLIGVTLPSGVTRIGSGVFQDCSNLVSITIPTGVTRIESGAFVRSGLQKAYFLGALPTNWISTLDPDNPSMIPPWAEVYFPPNTVILHRPGAPGWADYDFKGQPNMTILPRVKDSLLINTSNSTKFFLSFETVAGIQYSVQKSTTLGFWSNVWNTSGDGLVKSFEDQPSDRAFYRVLQH